MATPSVVAIAALSNFVPPAGIEDISALPMSMARSCSVMNTQSMKTLVTSFPVFVGHSEDQFRDASLGGEVVDLNFDASSKRAASKSKKAGYRKNNGLHLHLRKLINQKG
ncbi:hypothetical protein [Flavobacterium sp.]|uniref:hypothetical protein n=1 Tax=Flavobacterium sp. TaxID=239 RepID=UPI003263AFF4